MTMEIGQDFDLRTGNYRELVFYVSKLDGSPMNLTSGFTAEWRFFRPSAQTPFLTKKVGVSNDINMTNAAEGEVTVKLKKVDTIDLEPGVYYHELVVTDALNEDISVSSGNGTLYRKKS